MSINRFESFKMIFAMIIFGTIGVFVRNIPLQSGIIALVRGIIGALFLLLVTTFKKRRISRTAIKDNLFWLCISGTCIGFNWILLFESYRYTSIAVSTLCYYMAPIIVILTSPFILRERLSIKKGLCVFTALTGMVCISGIFDTTNTDIRGLYGILLGLSAATLYAAAIITNKKLRSIDAYNKTIFQLSVSSLVLLPYCYLTSPSGSPVLTPITTILLLVVGIVHTGIAYYLYFGSMEHLSAQSVAIISYIDPVIALLVSVLLLNESMDSVDFLGAALILGAAFFSEFSLKNREEVI